MRPEPQLLQPPICFPSWESVQPTPLGCTLLFQTPEAQGAPDLAPQTGWRGADSWADRWPSQVRKVLLPGSFPWALTHDSHTIHHQHYTHTHTHTHIYTHTHIHPQPQCQGSPGLKIAPHHPSAHLRSPLPNPYSKLTAGVIGHQPDKPMHAKVPACKPLQSPQPASLCKAHSMSSGDPR